MRDCFSNIYLVNREKIEFFYKTESGEDIPLLSLKTILILEMTSIASDIEESLIG